MFSLSLIFLCSKVIKKAVKSIFNTVYRLWKQNFFYVTLIILYLERGNEIERFDTYQFYDE